MKNLLPNIDLENRVWGLDIMRVVAIVTVLILYSSEYKMEYSFSLIYPFGVVAIEISCLCLLMASLVYPFFELPVLKIREKFTHKE